MGLKAAVGYAPQVALNKQQSSAAEQINEPFTGWAFQPRAPLQAQLYSGSTRGSAAGVLAYAPTVVPRPERTSFEAPPMVGSLEHPDPLVGAMPKRWLERDLSSKARPFVAQQLKELSPDELAPAESAVFGSAIDRVMASKTPEAMKVRKALVRYLRSNKYASRGTDLWDRTSHEQYRTLCGLLGVGQPNHF